MIKKVIISNSFFSAKVALVNSLRNKLTATTYTSNTGSRKRAKRRRPEEHAKLKRVTANNKEVRIDKQKEKRGQIKKKQKKKKRRREEGEEEEEEEDEEEEEEEEQQFHFTYGIFTLKAVRL